MRAVAGIGFDLDHTLAIDNQLERVAFLRLLEVLLAEGGRGIGTLADEIDEIDKLLDLQRHAGFSIDEAVCRFVGQHGLDPSDRFVERYRTMAVAMVDEFLVPLPGVKPTLKALRESGIATAVLTNGWNPLQVCKAQRAGFHGPVLVSSEIGEQKPAPRAFEALLSVLGTQPEQTCFVGDDPKSDVAGAQAMGMQAVWINWERKEYPAGQPQPRQTIQSLTELLELLPAAARVT
jgi:HAD superfamily hydrolase (TIGR01509 family)